MATIDYTTKLALESLSGVFRRNISAKNYVDGSFESPEKIRANLKCVKALAPKVLAKVDPDSPFRHEPGQKWLAALSDLVEQRLSVSQPEPVRAEEKRPTPPKPKSVPRTGLHRPKAPARYYNSILQMTDYFAPKSEPPAGVFNLASHQIRSATVKQATSPQNKETPAMSQENFRVVQLLPSDGTKAVFADPDSKGELVTVRPVAHWSLVEVWDNFLMGAKAVGYEVMADQKRVGAVIGADGQMVFCENSRTFLGYISAGGEFDKSFWVTKAYKLLNMNPPPPKKEPEDNNTELANALAALLASGKNKEIVEALLTALAGGKKEAAEAAVKQPRKTVLRNVDDIRAPKRARASER